VGSWPECLPQRKAGMVCMHSSAELAAEAHTAGPRCVGLAVEGIFNALEGIFNC
jgi:hypothetical protein